MTVVRRLKSNRQVTTHVQTLQKKSNSGLVTVPHRFLERDDILEDGELPDEQNLVVDRLDRRMYLVRFTDGGSIPDVEEAEAIERIAARLSCVQTTRQHISEEEIPKMA